MRWIYYYTHTQGPRAEAMMRQGMDRGRWVFFQNCHLSPSWMPALERLIEQIEPDKVRHQIFISTVSTSCVNQLTCTFVTGHGILNMTVEWKVELWRDSRCCAESLVGRFWWIASTHAHTHLHIHTCTYVHVHTGTPRLSPMADKHAQPQVSCPRAPKQFKDDHWTSPRDQG